MKQRGIGHFFLAYYLLVFQHLTEPNDLEQFLSLINLSSPLPCCQFADCLMEACRQRFVFIFHFGSAKSGFDVTWQYCTLKYFDQSFTLKDVFLAVQDSPIGDLVTHSLIE